MSIEEVPGNSKESGAHGHGRAVHDEHDYDHVYRERPTACPRQRYPQIAKRPKRPRLLKKDTVENYKRLFIENGWTDGMPTELPTGDKVAEMLTGTDHPPDVVLGLMSVTTHEERYEYTVEKVALNAVVAGARPEHFPVILALAAGRELFSAFRRRRGHTFPLIEQGVVNA